MKVLQLAGLLLLVPFLQHKMNESQKYKREQRENERSRGLTGHIWLQGFRHEGPGDLQLFWSAAARLQSERQTHAFQNLHVIVNLEHVVEIEQVLEPEDRERQMSGCYTGRARDC